MPLNTLSEWIETSPETVFGFRLLLGERGETHTIGIVLLDESVESRFPRYSCLLADNLMHAAELVESMADSAGWKSEHPTLRVIAVDGSAKPITSWQRTSALHVEDGQGPDPVSAMADALIRGFAEVRRSLKVVVDGSVEMQERHDAALASFLESREELADTRAELDLVTAVAEMEEEGGSDPLEVATANMLDHVVGAMANGRPTLTARQAKQLLAESPDLLRKLAEDPEVVGMFVGALGGAAEEPPTDGPDTEAGELQGAPADDPEAPGDEDPQSA